MARCLVRTELVSAHVYASAPTAGGGRPQAELLDPAEADAKALDMNSSTQSFLKLATSNAELLTRLAQSPELAELVQQGARKYFELVQSSVGVVMASDTHADLVRRLSESYLSFAQDYADSLASAAGPISARHQIESATHRFDSWGKAAADAITSVSQRTAPPRSA
jgi:hypothetical protein